MNSEVTDSLWRIGFILLLVGLTAFFVAAEFALVGVRKTRVESLARTGSRPAKRLNRQLESLDAYISATQLGITLASLALGWVGEEALGHMLTDAMISILPEGVAVAAAKTVGIAISFSVITFLLIVLGELAPKTLALQRAESVALTVSLPLELFYKALKFPIWLLTMSGNLVVRMFGLEATAEHSAVYTSDELRHLVDLSHTTGHLNAGERELIHNVFEFAAETVRDCMVGRTAVTSVSIDRPLAELVELFRATEYSRIPAFEGSMDGVVGVLHARDVLGAAVAGGNAEPRALVRPTIFVPPNAQLDEVLARMKRSGHHLAIVVDEHGGFQGIVTLEDILEELVGEIRDEFDDGGEDPVVEQTDGSVIIDASISIRALNKRLGLEVPESSAYVTLAGFLLSESGSIPRQGSELEAAGRSFVIENIRRNRIISVRLLAAASS